MQEGDIQTITLKKNKEKGSFLKTFEMDWLVYAGYTEKELEQDEISIVLKADRSEHKKIKFLGFGKPLEKK